MADMSESPGTNRPKYRLGGMSSFIPLNDDSALTTRGQHLPGLIQNRSSGSLLTMNRRSTLGKLNDEEANADTEGNTPLRRTNTHDSTDPRRMSTGAEVLMTPQMRSMRLIGNSNPRYRWEQYYKSKEELRKMSKPLRAYYERNNFLVSQYLYIDRLLDSSLPHDLIQEYNQPAKSAAGANLDIPGTIHEEPSPRSPSPNITPNHSVDGLAENGFATNTRVKRTPKAIYKLPDENTALLGDGDREDTLAEIEYEADEDVDSSSPTVTFAIYLNFAANFFLLCGKIAVIVLTSSLSVLASLVDAALDFLSTAIVWTTTKLIAHQDSYAYPVGRRRLEPVGVLVFSIIMITSFFQVGLECIQRLASPDHTIVNLGLPAIIIMLSTVVIKGFCYVWCRLIKNSSVQALAQDAMTDVVFNIFSIIFPLIGYYASIWWLDALGGLLLSAYVIFNWAKTSSVHIRQLTGAAATADQRNVLLYLAMRFAKPIQAIQGLQAYHAGDKLNVEVDIVLDEDTNLKDSHDLGESLQYVLESVPTVDRAFVHADYKDWNLASHMNQQSE